ncbi:MAG: aldehyde dehydrogenase family protein, partial [Pseudomonadota bacterium]
MTDADATLSDDGLFRQQAFIAGVWRDADDGRTTPIHDPATGAAIGTVPLMGAAETRAAIDAAAAAWPAWRARTAADRAGVLRRWHDLIL